jgi:tetratricopeptide (TPR) repeat protein
MSRALARKKAGTKSQSRSRLQGKGSGASVKSKNASASAKSPASGQAAGRKSPSKTSGRSPKSSGKRSAGRPAARQTTVPTTGSRVRRGPPPPAPPPEKPPRLLSESKQTSAALALLEKGIKLLFQKDFKRARHELEAIASHYPAEHEIIARSRSYLQVCDREEGAQKKPSISNDQLYTLGVLEHNQGNFDAAIGHFLQSLERHGSAEYVYYSLAASHARKRDVGPAVQNLRRAIELNEDNRVYAKNDPDFASLHREREFTELVGLPGSSDSRRS